MQLWCQLCDAFHISNMSPSRPPTNNFQNESSNPMDNYAMTKVGVQIFCLIYCAPLHTLPIKLGQLASPIKWDNPLRLTLTLTLTFNFNVNVDVNLNSFDFCLLHIFCFFYFVSSLCCLIVFLTISQSFIVHCYRDSFCPIAPYLFSTFERLLLKQATFNAF